MEMVIPKVILFALSNVTTEKEFAQDIGKIPVLPKLSLSVSNSVYYRTGGMK